MRKIVAWLIVHEHRAISWALLIWRGIF